MIKAFQSTKVTVLMKVNPLTIMSNYGAKSSVLIEAVEHPDVDEVLQMCRDNAAVGRGKPGVPAGQEVYALEIEGSAKNGIHFLTQNELAQELLALVA